MLRRLAQLKSDSFMGSLVRLPLKLVPKDKVMSVRGGINKGASWIAGSSIHGCWLGTYEADKQDQVSKMVKPAMIVWDVGANAGFYTVAFSRLVGPEGHVYAFEPLGENTNNVLRHVGLNQLENVTVVQAAVGAASGLVGFQVAMSNAMGRVSNDAGSYLVPCLTVDSFIAKYPDARPDLLKIDIEGGETALLEGASNLLRDHAPEILLALHGREQSDQCAEILTELGYNLYYLDGTPAIDRPLKSDEIHARISNGAQ